MPTINKINLNGVSYDIGGGLTEDVKQASLQIAEKVAYIDENGQDYYDDLYNAFYDNTWAISANLSNASSSNPVESIEKGSPYTTIISANTGYTLQGATVQVTMSGANVTSAVYSNGVVNIPAVTGDVVITVVAVALTVVSISAVYTQSGTVYDTDSLDSLKDDLVVTATFNDSSTEVVPSDDYALSGTLTEETSTITVSYGGSTTTFTVTVIIILYPLPDKVTETANYKLTTSHNGHVEFEVLQNWSVSPGQGVAINLLTGACGATNAIGVNNQPKTFTFPANASIRWGTENVVNALNTDYTGNFRVANSSQSASGTSLGPNGYITGDATITTTITSATDIYYPFFYIATGSTAASGTKISLDLFVYVNDTRYV